MEFKREIDDRAVSEIIGAILVFGLVVLSLVIFQTNAVPAANEEVEFDHNQEVQADLLELDAELSDAAASGNGGTAVVSIGMDYPTRFLFRNPPPVSGSLTAETSEFSITNAEAVGDTETDDYWDGNELNYDSRQLVYRVDYNVYQSAPTTVISHGVVYDRFEDGTTRRIDAGGFIDGRSIELTALAGRRNESRVGDVSVPATAQSAATGTVRVRDDPTVPDDNIRLTVRTEATAAEWEGFLEDEEHVETVLGPADDPTIDAGTVDVVLAQDVTYELELARVAVGPAPYDPDPAYVTTDGETTRSVTTGQSSDLTVEVRDQYNGVLAGKTVTFETDYPTLPTVTQTVTTDDEGRATLPFSPAETGDVTVTATVAGGTGGPNDPLRVVYDLSSKAPGTGDETQGSDGELNPGGAEALVLTKATLQNCTPADVNQRTLELTDPNCRVDTTFENRGQARTITAVRVNVYSATQAYPIGERGSGQTKPRPRPDGWSFEGSADQDFANGGLMLSSPRSFASGTTSPYPTTTYQFEFGITDAEFGVTNGQYNAAEGDFYVLTFRFSDGSTSSYVVAPQD